MLCFVFTGKTKALSSHVRASLDSAGKIVSKMVGKIVGKIVGKKVGKIVGKIIGKLVGKAVEDIQNWQLSAAAPPALRDNKLPFLLLQTTTFAQSYKGRNRLLLLPI